MRLRKLALWGTMAAYVVSMCLLAGAVLFSLAATAIMAMALVWWLMSPS